MTSSSLKIFIILLLSLKATYCITRISPRQKMVQSVHADTLMIKDLFKGAKNLRIHDPGEFSFTCNEKKYHLSDGKTIRVIRQEKIIKQLNDRWQFKRVQESDSSYHTLGATTYEFGFRINYKDGRSVFITVFCDKGWSKYFGLYSDGYGQLKLADTSKTVCWFLEPLGIEK